jgi:branched-chain amino acid transport system permease protein
VFATMSELVVGGMAAGLVYVLLAAGLILVLSVSRVFLVAYGQFYMVAAYVTYLSIVGLKLPYAASLVVAVVATGILGVLSYLLIFRWVEHATRQFLATIVAATGLMLILNQWVLSQFGTSPRGIPTVFPGTVSVGGASISVEKLVICGVSVVVTLVLFYIYEKTRTGRAMRAVAYLPEIAALNGINVTRVHMITLGIAGVLAGFAGAIMAPAYGVTPGMGNSVVLTVLLVAMLGGMDSLLGAVVGGLIVGVTLSVAQFFIPKYSQVILFVIIGIVIFLRPGGIVGRAAKVKV